MFLIKSFCSSSNSGFSIYRISPSNCSSNPYSVKLKFITVTLINISGKNYGLESLEQINNLKFESNSISLSPILIIFFLFERLIYLSNIGSKQV